MTYEQIKNTAPEGIAKKVKKIRPIGPKNALLFFFVTMLLFLVFGSLIQYALGMIGVLITELFFLLASVLYVKWKRQRLRDVFPIKKPKLTAVIGTLILWFGSYLMMILSNMLIMAYFPDFPVSSDADSIMGADLNWLILFFIVAILPPICEEAMHRGVIQFGLKKKIRNPWIMACVIGLIFGIFHLDVSKFFATGLLGGVMGWILFQTDNMVYSSLFHFVHNGFQMVLMLVIPAVAKIPGDFWNGIGSSMVKVSSHAALQSVSPLLPQTVAENGISFVENSATVAISAGVSTVFLGIIIPITLYIGNFLLRRDIAPRRISFLPKEKKLQKTIILRLAGSSIAIVVVGVLTIAYGFMLI